LQTAPAALKEAWSGLVASRWSSPATNRLLRIALYYRLLFSNEILSSEESSDLPRLPSPQTTEESLVLDVYNMTEAEREAAGRGVRSGEPEGTPQDAFADAVEVYARRIEEVNPKRAARLRRAIRGGCLDFEPYELNVEGEENWLPWALVFEMPQRARMREDFQLDDEDNPKPDCQDRKLRRSQALDEGIGRGIADALADFATSTEREHETGKNTSETVKRLFEFAKPTVNVYALPTFGEFAFMCAAGTLIVCGVLIGLRLLGLR